MIASLPTTLSDRLNPIALKELRQAVNSRFVPGLVLLTLALLQAAFSLYAASVAEGAGPTRALGWPLFAAVAGVLFLAVGLGVPLAAGCRLAAEVASGEGDLLMATPLSPMRVLRGKLAAAAAVAGLLAAACVPFLTASVLLRGVGVTQVLAVLALEAVAFAAGACVALFLGALPLAVWPKALLSGIGGLAAGLVLLIGFGIGLGAISAGGLGGLGGYLLGPLVVACAFAAVGAVMLLAGAAAMISPCGLRYWQLADDPARRAGFPVEPRGGVTP